MKGNNLADRSKLGTKRHIVTDKKEISLSAVISSASTHDINLVADVVGSTVIRRGRGKQHLCLDKGYNSKQEEQESIKRRYVLHIPIKKKKEGKKDDEDEIVEEGIPNRKKYSLKRWGCRAYQFIE